jgi:hypothetical protein
MGSPSSSLSPSASRTPNSGRKRPTACPPASPGRPPPCPVAAATRAGRKALSRSICSEGVGLDLAYLLDQHPSIEIQASRSADTPSPCESSPSPPIRIQWTGPPRTDRTVRKRQSDRTVRKRQLDRTVRTESRVNRWI